MKTLAILSTANVMFLPVACPLLAGLTVMAMGAAWLVWPVAELIGAVIE